MMARFPPPETVSDPLLFFHPRVYCWLSLGRALFGDRAGATTAPHRTGTGTEPASPLRRSRGQLARVEIDAILGITDGTSPPPRTCTRRCLPPAPRNGRHAHR